MSVTVIIYIVCALLLTIYGINAHIMTQLFMRRFPASAEKDKKYLNDFYHHVSFKEDQFDALAKLPTVTTQLPVYNECNVVERLIDAVVAFRYPLDKHEIQVLDDSTDESRQFIAEKVRVLQQKGVNIHHITRNSRTGFKAGALRHGLERAMGEFVAIFDADFLPQSDFLLCSMPFFCDRPRLGLVQARWGHLNEKESLVTRLQAIGINSHFMIEQAARSTNNLFMNFNGTAGIIRKKAIIDAGNWQGDTLTEDMDLSYRLQLNGWTCHYLAGLVAPAELPSDLNGFKNQQFRWAKGSTQTAIKLMPQILRSSATSFKKFQAFMHMTHYCIHPLMLILALLAPIMLFSKVSFLTGAVFFIFGSLLFISCTGPSRMYLVAEKAIGKKYLRTAIYLPLMVCFGCGLAVNNTKAVLEALIGKSSGFVRTPKSGSGNGKIYGVKKSSIVYFEILTGLWCLYGVNLYLDSHHYLIGHFMSLYAIGFLCIGIGSWWHAHRGMFS